MMLFLMRSTMHFLLWVLVDLVPMIRVPDWVWFKMVCMLSNDYKIPYQNGLSRFLWYLLV